MTKPATVFAVTVVTLGIVVCVLALKPSSAGAVTRCEKLDTRYIKARDIRTFGGLGCVRICYPRSIWRRKSRLFRARLFALRGVGYPCIQIEFALLRSL